MDKIIKLKNELIKAIATAEKQATNEQQYQDLTDICVDLLDAIPITLLQKDYFPRQFIREKVNELDENDKDNTQKINQVMQYLYDQDAIYIGDYAIENIASVLKN